MGVQRSRLAQHLPVHPVAGDAIDAHGDGLVRLAGDHDALTRLARGRCASGRNLVPLLTRDSASRIPVLLLLAPAAALLCLACTFLGALAQAVLESALRSGRTIGPGAGQL